MSQTLDSTDRLQALERQLRSGWASLRFESPLEEEFRARYRLWAMPFRLTLIGVAAILIAVTPLLDLWLLHPPAEFMVPAHVSQVLVMLPVLLLTWFCSHRPGLQRWEDAVSVLAVLTVTGGLLYQRHLGAQYQVWVPTELITATLAGAYVMGGFGFRRMTPLAALLLVAVAGNELWSYGNNATSHYIVFGVIVQLLIAGLAGYLQERFARGAWLRGELLEILASQDSLTGLLNFRAFEQRYQQMVQLAVREHKPVLVVLLDLDYFKQYNDAYGHAAGNTCLRRIADHLAHCMQRRSDLCARMGGEEFVLAFYGIDRDYALQRLEAVRASVEALALPHERSALPAKVVTASLGALWWRPLGGVSADAALREADRCLYAAKDAGRNRVMLSPQSARP